jgi:hypothetical protein
MAQNWEITDNFWCVERSKLGEVEQLVGDIIVAAPSEEEQLEIWNSKLQEAMDWLNAAREESKSIQSGGDDEIPLVDLLLKEVKVNLSNLLKCSNHTFFHKFFSHTKEP